MGPHGLNLGGRPVSTELHLLVDSVPLSYLFSKPVNETLAGRIYRAEPLYPVTGPAPRGDSGCVCFWVSVRVPDGWCECVRVRRVGPEVL